MKYLISILKIHSLSIAICFSLLLLGSCGQQKENKEATSFEGKTSSDTVSNIAPVDAQSKRVEPTEPTAKVEGETPHPVTPKICDPNFTLIGKPKKNHYVYYVTGFNPEEFKCWEALQDHGVKISEGQPCLIFYIDAAKISLNSTPPYYMDKAILAKHGIGQFEHSEHWWEVKGANIWGKDGKGYAYYNTNNNAGG